MQNIGYKRGVQSPNFGAALAAYLEKEHHRKQEDFAADFKKLEELRKESIAVTSAPESIPQLIRYVGNLHHLSSKFPLDEDNIKITFSWYNFGGKETKPIASHDLLYEQACVLVNLALLNARLGNMEGRSTPDKLRRACNFYLVAAGVIQHVLENYTRKLTLPSSSDMTESVMLGLKEIFLAQAQECFVLKGTMDKTIRDPMLAKLSNSTAGLYAQAAEMAEAAKNSFGSSWALHCRVKQQYFLALANFKKSAEALVDCKYGMELGRLEIANGHIKEAKASLDALIKKEGSAKVPGEMVSDITALLVNITKNFDRSKKDNDIIYHEQVPSREAIGDIGAAIVANPIAFKAPHEQFDIIGTPIFDKLPTFKVQKEVFGFYQRRDSITNELIAAADAEIARIDEEMTRMNLPNALEQARESNMVPPAIVEKSNEVRNQGGFYSLESQKATVDYLRQECLDRIASIKKIIEDEEKQDSEHRLKHGKLWKREPSIKINKNMKERLETMRKTLEKASDSDKLVAKRIEEVKVGLQRLVNAGDTLEYELNPNQSALSKETVESNLRQAINAGDLLIFRARDLRKHAEDTSAALNTAFLSEPDDVISAESKAELTEAELGRFDWIRSGLEELKGEIDMHLLTLQSAYDTFYDLSGTQSAIMSRSEQLHSMEKAFTEFSALSGNLAEGVQFYSKAGDNLLALEEEAKDFRDSRAFEFDDLMATIEPPVQQPPASQSSSAYGGYEASFEGYPQQQSQQNHMPPPSQSPYQQSQQQQHQQAYPPTIQQQQPPVYPPTVTAATTEPRRNSRGSIAPPYGSTPQPPYQPPAAAAAAAPSATPEVRRDSMPPAYGSVQSSYGSVPYGQQQQQQPQQQQPQHQPPQYGGYANPPAYPQQQQQHQQHQQPASHQQPQQYQQQPPYGYQQQQQQPQPGAWNPNQPIQYGQQQQQPQPYGGYYGGQQQQQPPQHQQQQQQHPPSNAGFPGQQYPQQGNYRPY